MSDLVIEAGPHKLVRWIVGGGSYLSSSDKRLLFGLGTNTRPEVSAVITWPSGQTQTVSGLAVNRYHKITEPR